MARPLRRPGNLPAEATSFIGRRRELAELRKRLATARLVTLTGPGGVGKTRLAIRSATELARAFPGGAWLVELADVRTPPHAFRAQQLRKPGGGRRRAMGMRDGYLRGSVPLTATPRQLDGLTAAGRSTPSVVDLTAELSLAVRRGQAGGIGRSATTGHGVDLDGPAPAGPTPMIRACVQ